MVILARMAKMVILARMAKMVILAVLVPVHHSKCLVSASLQAVVGGCFKDCDECLGFIIAPTACHLSF